MTARTRASKVAPPKKAERFTAEEVAQALRESHGYVSVTARRLACDARTVYRCMERYPELAEVRKEVREAEKDTAEHMLSKLVRGVQVLDSKGQVFLEPPNLGAICFYLKTQAKDRGYIERVENLNFDVSRCTDEQLARIARGEDPSAVIVGATR